MYHFSKTQIGYQHARNQEECEDFSSSYHDEERTIITACDGHGGRIYIRSRFGSRFASLSLLHVLLNVQKIPGQEEDFLRQVKLSILVEWNRMIEEHLNQHPISESETGDLSEEERAQLEENPIKAYGTTMIGAMAFQGKLLLIQLGDGESILFRKEKPELAFPESEDETVANLTYSLCSEDAYSHMKAKILNLDADEGVLLCTDGLVNPYQNFENLFSSFVEPVAENLRKQGNISLVSDYVERMGEKDGFGDDVSLSFLLQEKKDNKGE